MVRSWVLARNCCRTVARNCLKGNSSVYVCACASCLNEVYPFWLVDMAVDMLRLVWNYAWHVTLLMWSGHGLLFYMALYNRPALFFSFASLPYRVSSSLNGGLLCQGGCQCDDAHPCDVPFHWGHIEDELNQFLTMFWRCLMAHAFEWCFSQLSFCIL